MSISPFNVLILDNFEVKVIDLFKKDDQLEKLEKIDYSKPVKMFLAPEALDEDETRQSQIFSLGCLLYLMIKLKHAPGPKPDEISPFTCEKRYAGV